MKTENIVEKFEGIYFNVEISRTLKF